jgi:hypothetical protein
MLSQVQALARRIVEQGGELSLPKVGSGIGVGHGWRMVWEWEWVTLADVRGYRTQGGDGISEHLTNGPFWREILISRAYYHRPVSLMELIGKFLLPCKP